MLFALVLARTPTPRFNLNGNLSTKNARAMTSLLCSFRELITTDFPETLTGFQRLEKFFALLFVLIGQPSSALESRSRADGKKSGCMGYGNFNSELLSPP